MADLYVCKKGAEAHPYYSQSLTIFLVPTTFPRGTDSFLRRVTLSARRPQAPTAFGPHLLHPRHTHRPPPDDDDDDYRQGSWRPRDQTNLFVWARPVVYLIAAFES